MKELNLCKILKGHKGETFYCSLVGQEVTLTSVFEDTLSVDYVYKEEGVDESCISDLTLYSNGSKYKGGECLLFPSKEQRDWNNWAEEQKSKVPKTWSELIKFEKAKSIAVWSNEEQNSQIAKSAASLLKIYQLIEISYKGNITDDERKHYIIYQIEYNVKLNELQIVENAAPYKFKNHIAFRSKELAEEFLSHPENIQLLKDYFMI